MVSEKEELKLVETDPCFAVFYRHFKMPGGVITYGSAEIVGFYETFEESDKEAEGIFKQYEGAPDLHVWIMRCLKTYNNGGIAIERGFKV